MLGGAIVACKVRGVPSRIFVTYNDGTRRAGAADEGAVRASLAVADGRVELKRAANSESLWSAPGCSSRASTCEMCTGAADGLCAWRAAGFASAAHGLGGDGQFRCVSVRTLQALAERPSGHPYKLQLNTEAPDYSQIGMLRLDPPSPASSSKLSQVVVLARSFVVSS